MDSDGNSSRAGLGRSYGRDEEEWDKHIGRGLLYKRARGLDVHKGEGTGREGGEHGHLDLALRGELAFVFPARVWQRAPSFRSGCGVDTAALRLLLLQQLLRLCVIQGARAGLDGHCVCLHAYVIPKKAPP